ncbi:MAG: 4-hydroxythreonine-4-phosphate dehydrogenase PdxA [Bacteroidales bacterium]|nr:4-hydroxythreonine-4-phosphate dehydrogenase PdxA [Bacteroidales bacterium]
MTQNIVIGITQGDINGIGYELIIKSLMDARILENITPVIYGSSKVLSYYRKTISKGNEFNYHIIRQIDQAVPHKVNVLNITDQELKIDMGEATPVSGKAAFDALEAAMRDVHSGKLDAIVTAPIHKKAIQSEQFHFQGHTEYFCERTHTADCLMLMVSDSLRIGTVTTHCALADVPKILSKELVKNKLRILHQSMMQDFACVKPRIAVLALNPHAGEEGLFGMEEETVIKPAIQEAFQEKIYAFGPFPADGFFGSGQYAKYDAVLAMYHDQAMLPFKILSYGGGVNYTAGLPLIRTSPAHGTAYTLVGKDMASPDSFRQAIYQACDIYANRRRADLDAAMPAVEKEKTPEQVTYD